MNELKSALADGPILGEPLVSVSVITYNHGKYIRQCLDGILMQEVNFPYEILIHDDASPDDTTDIIKEYEAKYPTVIKPIYQTVNQYSQGVDVGRFNFDRAVGKYIAQCEGDDYWTDPKKLQVQVDFLEEHSEYVGTAHSVRVIDETGGTIKERDIYRRFLKHDFTINDTEQYRLPGQTASLVYRNLFKGMSQETLIQYQQLSYVGDRKLTLLLTLEGPIYCFEDIWSSYRHVLTGYSWSAQNHKNFRYSPIFKSLVEYEQFSNKYYHHKLIFGECKASLITISTLRAILFQNTNYFNDAMEIYSEISKNPKLFANAVIKSALHPIHYLECISTRVYPLFTTIFNKICFYKNIH